MNVDEQAHFTHGSPLFLILNQSIDNGIKEWQETAKWPVYSCMTVNQGVIEVNVCFSPVPPFTNMV